MKRQGNVTKSILLDCYITFFCSYALQSA